MEFGTESPAFRPSPPNSRSVAAFPRRDRKKSSLAYGCQEETLALLYYHLPARRLAIKGTFVISFYFRGFPDMGSTHFLQGTRFKKAKFWQAFSVNETFVCSPIRPFLLRHYCTFGRQEEKGLRSIANGPCERKRRIERRAG